MHPAGEAGVVRVEMSQDDQGDSRKTADRLLELRGELCASHFRGEPGIDQHPTGAGFEGVDVDLPECERHRNRELEHSIVGNLHRRSPFGCGDRCRVSLQASQALRGRPGAGGRRCG